MYEIRVPRLGWSMEEGIFLGWLKESGQEVAIGDPLFEFEGEKALQEVASVDAGILHIPRHAPQPGSVVSVGARIGYLLAPGEPIPSAELADVSPTNQAGRPIPEGRPDDVPPVAAPSVRRLARQLGVRLEEIARAGGSGRITAEHVMARANRQPPAAELQLPAAPAGGMLKPSATPRARRVAKELAIDWTRLRGSGRGGRIREADVRGALAAATAQPPAATIPAGVIPAMLPRRRAIAERLRFSRDRTIPVTLTMKVDAHDLSELRATFTTRQEFPVPSYTDIMACLVARVLKQHPALPVRWDDEGQSLSNVADSTLSIGIAVDTTDGLLVPVVRNVADKELLSVAVESRHLIERARSGRLSSSEMQGGVFTITNLGAFGIEAFTPVINYPETMILGLGAIRHEPTAMPDGRIVARPRLTLSLTFDHAAADGATAAAFLRELAKATENAAACLRNH